MIIERMHIFSGFQPCGFGDELNYQSKITQKSINELSNRLFELHKIEAGLKAHIKTSQTTDDLEQLFMRGDLYSLVRLII